MGYTQAALTRVLAPALPWSPPHFSDGTACVWRCCLPPWPMREASAPRKTRNQFKDSRSTPVEHLPLPNRGDSFEHRRDRQDDVPRDHSLVEHRAHLADPGIHVDFGAPQAQRGLTAHRHPMGALATLQATVFDIAHLVGISTPEHLRYQA